jgi:hypothetical protein
MMIKFVGGGGGGGNKTNRLRQKIIFLPRGGC